MKSSVKYIQSLSHKKLRDEHGVFVAEGPKIVGELLSSSGLKAHNIYATRNWLEIHRHILKDDTDVMEVDEGQLKRLSFLTTPHDVVGIFAKPLQSTPDFKGKLTLVLDGIQDPGNMGTIIRCADWFGVETIVSTPDCVDAFNPKVVQSSMGSICRVKFRQAEIEALLEEYPQINTLAAALSGDDVTVVGKIEEGFLLIGNESRGLSQQILNRARRRLTIPKLGSAESLNAALATGIILSHIR